MSRSPGEAAVAAATAVVGDGHRWWGGQGGRRDELLSQ